MARLAARGQALSARLAARRSGTTPVGQDFPDVEPAGPDVEVLPVVGPDDGGEVGLDGDEPEGDVGDEGDSGVELDGVDVGGHVVPAEAADSELHGVLGDVEG